MRILVDANVSRSLVEDLRRAGHDAAWIREIDHALPDPEIIVLAQQENRIILTADKDFGALVFHAGHQSPGIILIRIKNRELRNVRILSIFAGKGQELRGKFCVITDHAVRTRTLLQ